MTTILKGTDGFNSKRFGPLINSNISTNTGTSTVALSDIPDWATKMTLVLWDVGSSDSANVLIRAETVNGIQSAGYNTHSVYFGAGATGIVAGAYTDNILRFGKSAGTTTLVGVSEFTKTGGYEWMAQGMNFRAGDTSVNQCSGNSALGLPIIRFHLAVNTGTFNTGSVTVIFE